MVFCIVDQCFAVSGLRMDNDQPPRDLNSAALLRAHVHPAVTGLDGTGIVLCVVDYGFDLLHPAFRTHTGETRFAAIIGANGERLYRDRINRLIREAERNASRSALDSVYDAHANYFGRSGVQIGTHGSWVASIAAGSRTDTFCGVAPNATLVGVQLNLPDTAWREEDADGKPSWLDLAQAAAGPVQSYDTVGNAVDCLAAWSGWRSYEESSALVEALEDSFEFARSLRPEGIIFNLSVGAWAGAHDAGSAVNRAIDNIVSTGDMPHAPMVAAIAGTGNAGAEQGHFSGQISSKPLEFCWLFEPHARAQSKLEIWTDCPGGLSVDLTAQFAHDKPIWHFSGATREARTITLDGAVVGIGENSDRVRSGLSSVQLLLDPSIAVPDLVDAGACQFTVEVRSAAESQTGTVHAWIERDCANGALSKLTQLAIKPDLASLPNSCNDGINPMLSTLTPIACARSIISVAGLETEGAAGQLYALSSRGPRPWSLPDTMSNRYPAPLLAAPATGLFGARSKTDGYMRGSGTSGAAALCSGATALAMQAAYLGHTRLDRTLLAEALLGGGAWRNTETSWQPDIGLGELGFSAAALIPASMTDTRNRSRRTEITNDERTFSSPN